ncbi:secreted protein, partial [Candidatus Magnetobacterium bavaricum]
MIRDSIYGRLRHTIAARALWLGILLIIAIVFPAVSEANKTLTVANSPSAGGTITGSGINCGATCSKSKNNYADITLTATPAAGYVFVNWSSTSGACSGT